MTGLNLEKNLLKRLDVWQGGSSSIGGWTVLINASLSNIPTYRMSMFLLPKTTMESMDKTRRRFFWTGGGTKRKYHLVKWDRICRPKKKGGLGISSLRKMNISLLCKWWWHIEKRDGLWQEIVRRKYLSKFSITQVKHRLDDSPCWSDLLKVKNFYLSNRKKIVHNGENTFFWEDSWILEKPLIFLYPFLYSFCVDQWITVASCYSKN
uniref:Reverse transcriptase zinc-binding domain-containing protein n=1 Tax=Arundo donax TaxID=35708 RepID=A0A0A9G5B0_ARUDO